MPPNTIGPSSCSRRWNAVTMPKLPPPPRSPQNRSAFSLLGCVHHAAVGGHDLGLDEVVAHETELALEPAAAAAEREAGDTGRRHAATRAHEAVLLRRGIELAPREPGLGANAILAFGSTSVPFMPRMSTTMPASTTAAPVTPWPPP